MNAQSMLSRAVHISYALVPLWCLYKLKDLYLAGDLGVGTGSGEQDSESGEKLVMLLMVGLDLFPDSKRRIGRSAARKQHGSSTGAGETEAGCACSESSDHEPTAAVCRLRIDW